MAIEASGVGAIMKMKLEKYPDGVSKEDIEKGLVKPYEVLESEGTLNLTDDLKSMLGLNR